MSSSTPVVPERRTQAARRAATESALLTAAREVIDEHGVGALTLARIGTRAGYSRGIVTHHFGSKQGLLEAVTRDAQSGIINGLPGDAVGLDRLLLLIESYLSISDNGPGWSAFLRLWVEAADNPALALIMRERDDYFRGEVSKDVANGIASGVIDPDTDPHAVAVAVVGQLRGISLQVLLDPTAVELPRIRKQLLTMWRRVLTARP